MAMIDDLHTKISTLVNWPSSVPGWGAYFLEFLQSLDATQAALANVILSKAAGVHTHEGQGTLPILSRGVEADRLPDGVSLHLREDDVGRAEVIEDGALASTLVSDRAPRALAGLLADEQLPAENDPALGAVRFANAGAWAWGHFEAWLDGVAWRVVLEAMMSTAESAQVDLNLAYQVFGPDDAMNPVKTRWQASTAYTLGQQRIPTTPNGHYYQCTTAGTSGASEPTWPSTGTVSDGSVVWTRQGAGFKNLALAVTPPSAAHDRFDIDSSSLQIPAEEVSAGDRVHFGLWRSADDTHGGDLIVNELWIAPVEV